MELIAITGTSLQTVASEPAVEVRQISGVEKVVIEKRQTLAVPGSE